MITGKIKTVCCRLARNEHVYIPFAHKLNCKSICIFLCFYKCTSCRHSIHGPIISHNSFFLPPHEKNKFRRQKRSKHDWALITFLEPLSYGITSHILVSATTIWLLKKSSRVLAIVFTANCDIFQAHFLFSLLPTIPAEIIIRSSATLCPYSSPALSTCLLMTSFSLRMAFRFSIWSVFIAFSP